MKDIEYTCETRIIPGREGEPVKAIRLNNTETLVHHVTQGKEYGPISYTEHFMTGPIADKLYAYEALGYSPEVLKIIVDKHRRDMAWRCAVNSTYGVTIPKEAIARYVDTDRIKAMNDYILYDTAITRWVFDQVKVFQDRIVKTQAQVDTESNMKIKKVLFSDPATIVFWADGSKTVVKAENEPFDPEKGLAMAISKKALGNNHGYYDVFKKHLNKYNKEDKK